MSAELAWLPVRNDRHRLLEPQLERLAVGHRDEVGP
jgi:hypothetical protein